MASELREPRAFYMAGGERSEVADPAAHARKALLAEKSLDPAWSLAIMELASRGQITAEGVDRLLDFVRQWSLSDDRAWDWMEQNPEQVQEFIRDDAEGQMAELQREDDDY